MFLVPTHSPSLSQKKKHTFLLQQQCVKFITMSETKLHVVMVPWLAFGHMIPYLELSKYLVRRGHRVTFLSTPRNIERLTPRVPSHLSPLLRLAKLPLPPTTPDGLPADAEATSDVAPGKVFLLMVLVDLLEAPTRTFLAAHHPPPDVIIYDMFVHWAPRVARSLGLPCVHFSPISALSLCYIGPPSVLMAEKDRTVEQLMAPPPWVTVSSKVAYRRHEAVQIHQLHSSDPPSIGGLSIGYRLGAAIQGSDFVAVRSGLYFEPQWFPLLRELYGKPVLPVGFLSPALSLREDDDGEGERAVAKEMAWLDSQELESVVYVAFGSEQRLDRAQALEMALGLELSKLPFLWALREEASVLPEGFEERTRGRGLVRLGWSPQARFLAHPSVGCFFTHAGWASTVEGLSFGRPLVMLPMAVDQGLTTRRIEEMKLGVEVERGESDGSFAAEGIAKALKSVMMDAEGETIRANAKQMEKMTGDPASQDRCIEDLVQQLISSCKHQEISSSAVPR